MIQADTIVKAHNDIKEHIWPTHTLYHKNLSQKYNCSLYLKREDLQVVRSFKIRGAYFKMKNMSTDHLNKGVICASAGNHAQGVAYACSDLKVKGIIYMPTTTPKQKISKVKHFGGTYISIILKGDTYDDAYSYALAHAEQDDLSFIHPFNDREVMTGQGTIGVEMIEELPVSLDYLFIAVGGGGLLAGVGSYFRQISPQTKIIAVEAAGAPSFYEALKVGYPVKLKKIDSFADGIAVKMIGDLTFDICKEVADDCCIIPEGHICSSILQLYNDEAIVVEPAGAVSFSALDKYKDEITGKNVGIIVCGGNNDITRTEEIRERALMYEGRKHYFIIRFPQRAGALKDFLNLLGPEDDIAHFEYTKKNNRDSGPALVGIEVKMPSDAQLLIDKMLGSGINFEHLNQNPLLFEMLV